MAVLLFVSKALDLVDRLCAVPASVYSWERNATLLCEATQQTTTRSFLSCNSLTSLQPPSGYAAGFGTIVRPVKPHSALRTDHFCHTTR